MDSSNEELPRQGSPQEQSPEGRRAPDVALPSGAGGAEDGARRPSGRKRYSAVQRRSLVEAQRLAGQTVVDFCAEQGISPASLARWRKELGYQRASKQRGRAALHDTILARPDRAARGPVPRSARAGF